jgi:hypothetical protein
MTPDGDERNQAFAGLLAIIKLTPQVVFSCDTAPSAFILACASFEDPPGGDDERLLAGLSAILKAIQAQYKPVWTKVLRSMQAELVSRLLDNFRINN